MEVITLKSFSPKQTELKEKLIKLETNLKEVMDVMDDIVSNNPETIYDSTSSTDVLVGIFLNNVCTVIEDYINIEEKTTE